MKRDSEKVASVLCGGMMDVGIEKSGLTVDIGRPYQCARLVVYFSTGGRGQIAVLVAGDGVLRFRPCLQLSLGFFEEILDVPKESDGSLKYMVDKPCEVKIIDGEGEVFIHEAKIVLSFK